VIGYLALSIAIALAYFSTATIALPEIRRMAEVALLLALFTLPSYIAAWAMPHTSGDLLLYCLFFIGLTFGAILVYARVVLRRAVV
jgi:hypothetical protein